MIYMFGTGNPEIDQVLLGLAMQQHPLERTFPIEDSMEKPFVSVMDPEGYLYAFLVEDLGRM